MKLFEALDGDKYDIRLSHKYSNSITSIDLMPRFFRGNGARVPLAKLDRLLEFKNKFTYEEEPCLCTVTPAIVDIKQSDGTMLQMACFPSDSEELVEKIIFLIASTQGIQRLRLGGNNRHVVSFSIYQISQYLEMMGAKKSYQQIREILQIIRDSRTRVTRYNPGNKDHSIEMTQDVWADAAFEMKGNGRGKDKCYIAFSDYVADEILKLNYRQILFSRFTAYKSSFSRYLDLFLSSIWTRANLGQKYPLSLNQVMESYGKGNKSLVTKRRDMYAALDDLVARGVIKSRAPAIRKEPEYLNEPMSEPDFLFHIEPTEEFVEEMIISNAKKKGLNKVHGEIDSGERIALPDNIERIYSIG